MFTFLLFLITYFFPIWYEIPHMPFILNEAVQKQRCLTVVEFSTLASNVRPKEMQSLLLTGGGASGNEKATQNPLLFAQSLCLRHSIGAGEGEITSQRWEVREGWIRLAERRRKRIFILTWMTPAHYPPHPPTPKHTFRKRSPITPDVMRQISAESWLLMGFQPPTE